MDQAAAIDKNENKNELDTFKTKISEAVYQECESMKESLKELIQSSNECKQFKQKEAEIRLKVLFKFFFYLGKTYKNYFFDFPKFNENPDQFDEKNLKNLLNFKYVPQEIDHPKYLELEEIIENAKNGIESNGEDLVMESAPSNQVIKCPITGKPIQDLVKNALCDHSYEREAIMAYLKSRPNRK